MMKRNLILSLIFVCIAGCDGHLSDTTGPNDPDHPQKETIVCDTSEDCPDGYGCITYKRECVPLHDNRNCLSNLDCPDIQICAEESARLSPDHCDFCYCTFACKEDNDCISAGRNTKCSTRADILNPQSLYCTKIPATCGNGRLDEGELCDKSNNNNSTNYQTVFFSDPNPTCSLWNPDSTFKRGGIPGCATTCLGYSKGSGKTKCVMTSERNNVNGFDTCQANLFVDQDRYIAYANVNFTTTKKEFYDRVRGTILCGPKDTGITILTTSANMPPLTGGVTPCLREDECDGTITLTRDISNVAVGADEAQCIVLLNLAGAGEGTGSIICDLVYRDNETEMPVKTTLPSAMLANKDACVTIAGQCTELEKTTYAELTTDEERANFSCEADDFDLYEAYLAYNRCKLSNYPYITYKPKSGSAPVVSEGLQTVAVWDKYPDLIGSNGYPIKKTDALTMLKKGLETESGNFKILSDPTSSTYLTLKPDSAAPTNDNRVTQNTVAPDSGITTAPFDTLIIGSFPVTDTEESPLVISTDTVPYFTINTPYFGNYISRRLIIKGTTNGGNIAVSYTDGTTETFVEKDIVMPVSDAEPCPVIVDEETNEESLDYETHPGCIDADTESTRIFKFPDPLMTGDDSIKEVRIYLYNRTGTGNFRLNLIRLEGASTAIF